MKNFRKILIANRGEAAVRVIRTCRAMGISTVAVYSDADVSSLHVRRADEALYIGASSPPESYLNIERIIDAARRVRVDAVHPGYGFLSENPDFAEACASEDIAFIGPSAATLRRMGDKTVARALARTAGLPILSGSEGGSGTLDELRRAAESIGFPVMLKAAAGGGGRGIRMVAQGSEFESAFQSAEREAKQAFGDGRLFIEKYLSRARHVEVQIIGDVMGNLIHLFERECSLQRRHQKLIEETPAPIPSQQREFVCEAAIKLAKSLEYSNAGTVEFLVPDEGTPFFMEVNTRLQVEHPVTEMLTGLDLVQLQIEVAEGKPLKLSQTDVCARGHAIEARVCAEMPTTDFLPSIGRLARISLPDDLRDVRLDTGVDSGTDIGVHYDSMLAKVIAHAADRPTALRRLGFALENLVVQGVATNRTFLIALLRQTAVIDGDQDTQFIDRNLNDLVNSSSDDEGIALVVAAAYLSCSWKSGSDQLRRLPSSYRNNPFRHQSVSLEIAGRVFEVSSQFPSEGRSRFRVAAHDYAVSVLSWQPDAIRLEIDNLQHQFNVLSDGVEITLSGRAGDWIIRRMPRFPASSENADTGSATSPMPGRVLKILVEVGQPVETGDALIVLEAMKMEQTIKASFSGTVEQIMVNAGELVSPGDLLVRVVPATANTH